MSTMTIKNNIPDEEQSQYVMPYKQLESIYDTFMAKLDLSIPEMERTGSAVFYGFHKNWNLQKIITYYNLNKNLASSVWSTFGFKQKGGTKVNKTRSKKEVITAYLKQNVGQIITPAKLSEDVQISLPTFYNFYNANRQFFRKTGRGQFEILNPEAERSREV
jgi:hypothetical protein